MKKINILYSLLALVLVFSSCEDKDGITRIPMTETAPMFLNPNGSSSYTLIPENEEGAFETFIWEDAYFAEDVTPMYSLELDLATGDFSNPIVVDTTELNAIKITIGEMNQICRELEVVAGVATGLQARVKATGNDKIVYSIPVNFLVNRYIYEDEIIVWGIYGTTAGEAMFRPLVLNEATSLWESTMLVEEGEYVFKDNSYRQTVLGDDGTMTGKLVADGEKIATEAAVYKFSLDLENMTYTMEQSNFPNNIYLVGSHNGWDNATAGAHKNFFDGTYEVYQDFPENSACKWLPQLGSWDNDFGDDPNNPGNIISEGETNVLIPDAGFYLMQVDLSTQKWTATSTTWGIIGDATSGGWDAQTNFTTFDATTNTFTMEADLTVGSMKFRGTDDWSVNYGGTGLTGEPIPGGDNLSIQEAGTYSISLVLTQGGNYSYSIVKQ
ncbi:SusF/SusE family outer membrane protein [Saccharicrinis aurantiacus]|uniref:SusF/SusE family outer membrane protein n=1 Tax=Saccharicrinis aurantiacus TaxID=1849719 RepID=UPI0009501C9F|nr:SusF/SusE family outer membrane protein [Saccharicrinis aurantiacus]